MAKCTGLMTHWYMRSRLPGLRDRLYSAPLLLYRISSYAAASPSCTPYHKMPGQVSATAPRGVAPASHCVFGGVEYIWNHAEMVPSSLYSP